MKLSKDQLDHLRHAARCAPGRTAGRESVAMVDVISADLDERPDQAMEDVIKATEQVARAADNVIRVVQDVTPAAPIEPEVPEPAAHEISLSAAAPSQLQVVQVPAFVPPRRSRIPLAVALLALAFAAGATMSWLLFGGPSRTRDQAWNLVSLALETGKALPQIPGPIEFPPRHPAITLPATHGAANATPAAMPGRPTAQPGVPVSDEAAEMAPHRVAAADGGRPRMLVPPPASISTVATAAAPVSAPATPGSAGIASGEPSTAGAMPSSGKAVGALESDPKAPSARPGERSLSGIVLGALRGERPRTADKPAPDLPQSAAPPMPESAGAPVSESPVSVGPATGRLADCLATRPTNLRLAREETARLLKRGEEFMGEGRVSTARLMFQRAAEACDVRAAFALGASYDPIMLQKLGVALLNPDVATARSWYEKAKELGSSEASQELELLANWHP
jgi:hypothetical protein